MGKESDGKSYVSDNRVNFLLLTRVRVAKRKKIIAVVVDCKYCVRCR